MSRSSETWDCEKVVQALEPWLDGDLGALEDAEVRSHLASCADCAAQRRLAEAIRSELRALPELDAPPAVLTAIRARTAPATAPRRRWTDLVVRLPRPVWAALAVAVLALAVALPILWQAPAAAPDSDAAAIARATAEARFALAKAGFVTAEAGRLVRDRAIRDQIVFPAERGLSRSLGSRSKLEHGEPDQGANDV